MPIVPTNPIEKDLALACQAEGFGTLGQDLFYGQFPSLPDECIAVIISSGRMTIHSTKHTSILTILIRGKNYSEVSQIVRNIVEFFHGQANILIGDHNIGFIRSERLPIHVGKDPQGRHILSAEFSLDDIEII